MHKRSALSLLAALLLVGAGCARTETPPAVNSSETDASATTTSGSSGMETSPSPTGTKQYTSEPYDFSYPAAYTLTDRPMVESARKPYLDAGLDAPLQYVTLATVTRPDGFVGEGPASIYVIQWNNANRTPLRQWAKKQASYTGFTEEVDTSGKVTTATILDLPSLVYEYDGLYGGKARLIDLGGTVLQISADFDDDYSNMAAFDVIVTTLTVGK